MEDANLGKVFCVSTDMPFRIANQNQKRLGRLSSHFLSAEMLLRTLYLTVAQKNIC